MASDLDFVTYVVDQAKRSVRLSYRKMFGEFALYANGKVVALVCDNSVFLKPTEAGRAVLGEIHERPPYPGAKMWWVIDDELDNPQRLGEIFAATEHDLPPASPRARPKKRRSKE